MKEKYLYNYSFDKLFKTIKHYYNLLFLSKNLIVFKYMISFLIVLLLHTNNIYAQAKLTDTVSITKADVNGCEDSCRYKYTLIGSDLVEVKRETRSVSSCMKFNSCYSSEWCGKKYSYSVYYNCVNDRSTNGLYHKLLTNDYMVFKGTVIFYKLKCSYKGAEDLYFLKSDNANCSDVIKDKLNKCISECRKLKDTLVIGNKEIKTVGDLLDSIPATELLKVYDPNMVINY